jgi:SAM-dependent methyltransferase
MWEDPLSSFAALYESPDRAAKTLLFAESKKELRRLMRQRRDIIVSLREPFVPTPMTGVRKMLRLAGVKPGETVYDLGCGDGRIPIMAAEEFGARGIGVELRRDLFEEARGRVAEMHLEGKVKILRRDFMKVSLRKASVVALYLRSKTLAELIPKFERELPRGARVVTYWYQIPGWEPSKKTQIIGREIHRYGREKYIDRRFEVEICLYRG